jgi:DNA polymerase-4
MPSVTALRKCPDLIFAAPRFEVYRAVSQQIHAIFAQFTPLIEPLSLDEAYLDVTDHLAEGVTATETAQAIRALIRAKTALTASAGVSYNKFLAKLASGQNKPDGQFVITPKQGPDFVENLAVGRFHGVGPATAAKMRRLGIETGRDLKACPAETLKTHFGKASSYYFAIARGVDERPVRPDRERKSIGAEKTFLEDLVTLDAAQTMLFPIIDKVWRHCEIARLFGRSVTLKVKFADFQIVTRSHTGVAALGSRDEIERQAMALLAPLFPAKRGIRLLGVTVSGFEAAAAQAEGQLSFELAGD